MNKWRERLRLKRVNTSVTLGCLFVHSRVMFEAARRRGTFEEVISKNTKTDFIKLCNILLTSRYGLC